MEYHTLYARFQGEVQGVGFRATAARIARRYSLSGWVMNQADGSVRLEATGPRTDLELFLRELRASPLGPGIQSEDLSFQGRGAMDSLGFEIRYY